MWHIHDISQWKKTVTNNLWGLLFQIFSSLKFYVLSGLLQGRERSLIYDLLQSLCIAIDSTRLLSLRISNMAYCVNLFLKKSIWCINDNKMDLYYFTMWTRNTRWLPIARKKTLLDKSVNSFILWYHSMHYKSHVD